MENNKTYLVAEFTSHEIKILAGYVLGNQVYVLDCLESDCHGLKNGLIIDKDVVIKTFKSLVSSVETDLKMKFSEVTLSLPSINLFCGLDFGSTQTCSQNNIVQRIDIENILSLIKKNNAKDHPSLEFTNIVPDTFFIESEKFDEAPIGKSASQISVHAAVYGIDKMIYESFKNVVAASSMEVRNFVPNAYGACLYLSTIQSKNKIPDSYLLIDIGYNLTTISQIHEKTQVIKSESILFGGDDITQAISKKFNISYNESELLKCQYGMDDDPLFDLQIEEGITFGKLTECIEECLKENFAKIRNVIKNKFTDSINSKIVFIGGTSNLNNFYQLATDELKMTSLAINVENFGARNKNLVSLLGLVKFESMQDISNEDTDEEIYIENKKSERKKNYRFDRDL